MMILEVGEICPFSQNCPYNKSSLSGPCFGTIKERDNTYTCSFVVNGKIIRDSDKFITPGDKTGKMRIIMD